MHDKIIAFASTLITECGRKLLAKRQGESLLIKEKSSCSDIVTAHDIWVQSYLIEQIRARYPAHTFIGEENVDNASAGFCWVIDPIDGTSNYSVTGTDYAISVALCVNRKLFYGWVYDVYADKMYQGYAGTARHASCSFSVKECLLSIGYKSMRELTAEGIDPYKLCEKFRGVRYKGCASLELCEVSEANRVYISTHLMLWDFVAAAAILSSRGYIVRAAKKDKYSFYVCACCSELAYEQCLDFIPHGVRNKMQAVTDSELF